MSKLEENRCIEDLDVADELLLVSNSLDRSNYQTLSSIIEEEKVYLLIIISCINI